MVSRFTTNSIRRAEKKARRKIEKYEQRGIHITSKQSPIKSYDKSSDIEARQYLKELKQFSSSKTRYLRGDDGVAIPEGMYREYKKLQRELQPKYNNWWEEHRGERTIHGGKETEQTVGTEAWALDSDKKYPYGKYFRDKDISEFKSEQQMIKEIEDMRKQLDPDYERKKAENIREGMEQAVSTFHEPWLNNLIDELTDDEIMQLNYRTDFVETFYAAYNLTKSELMSVNEIDEYNTYLEHIFNTVKAVTGKDLGNMYDYMEFNDDYEVDYNDYDF